MLFIIFMTPIIQELNLTAMQNYCYSSKNVIRKTELKDDDKKF